MHLKDTVNVAVRHNIRLYLHNRQRLKQRPAHTGHLAATLRQQKRNDAMRVGIHLHDRILIVILYRVEHHTFHPFIHITKIVQGERRKNKLA